MDIHGSIFATEMGGELIAISNEDEHGATSGGFIELAIGQYENFL